ncbi:pyridoxine 5'-phosphate synthase [Fulvitalea axinellae]|uniref:Pyridoxine 5'-phosphate synthase n=1 Tax=Fulvitalea axinellae TaxID=1182444 RepID=A0AAU9CKY4_9BACT|nr:pyridoxine 5'-phosphate synthase [Fulvitalea axinellae]
MTKLSVNINKVATLRNSRGHDNPNVVQVAKDCERFGGQGITVHPRPDERHITKKDCYDLFEIVTTEFNIEGYPDERYMKIVEETKPAQATLVPDAPDAITSNAGWDTVANAELLKGITKRLQAAGARVSIFVDPDPVMVEGAAKIGADRVELYTEPYADGYEADREAAVKPYVEAAEKAKELGLGINAGHDLDLNNLRYLKERIPNLDEVSIGHALISDALYFGLENTIQMYLRELDV